MKYTPLPADLYVRNRAKLARLLKPQSLVVLQGNDIQPTSADGTRAFIQQTDLLYLCGIDQEETVLLLSPDCREPEHRAVLFIRETSEEIAIWEGKKLTKAEATAISGIETVYWTHEFDRVWQSMVFQAEHIYLNTNEHLRSSTQVESRDDRFLKWCMGRYPLHRFERLNPLMHQLRALKEAEEVVALREACRITESAFRRVLGFVKPGVWEFEIEAEILHEFVRNRSRRTAYESIIASGPNSCVLHHIANDRQCQDGDILLLDFGAEYANYNADLTRSIPVNGRFSPRQKAVYEAVLRVQKAASGMLVPGNNWKDYHEAVGEVMEKELVDIGLLNAADVAKQDKKRPLYKKYFMHGTSHHLGLDVHDYGSKYHVFEPGMVFTCEPGIYIREEGLGVRIENNLLITDGAPIDLMASIPREVEEIETIMINKGR